MQPGRESALGDGVVDVLLLSAEREVRRVHTGRPVARVHDHLDGRYGSTAVMELVAATVSVDPRTVGPHDVDVAGEVAGSTCEDPAAVRLLLDTRPEPIYDAVSLRATASETNSRLPPLTFLSKIAFFANRKVYETSIIGPCLFSQQSRRTRLMTGAHTRTPSHFRSAFQSGRGTSARSEVRESRRRWHGL